MVKNVIVACSDKDVRKIVLGNVFNLFGEKQVSVCNYNTDLYSKAKYAEDTAIIFDKYFLGYVISYTLTRLKILNEKVLAYFVEIGDCSPYFALRVYDLGTDGFIPDIEGTDFKNTVQKVQAGLRVFPDHITQRYEDADYDRRCITEVSDIEMKIGIYLSQGKSQKEICYLTGLTPSAVSSGTHRLKRKIGYTRPSDLVKLNERYFDFESGGFINNDC